MKNLYRVEFMLCLICCMIIPFILSIGRQEVYPANQDNAAGPQEKVKVTDERHIAEGASFYLNIPDGGLLLTGSVTVKNANTGEIYKNGQNYIAYNAHAEESGFTNSIYVMLSGTGKEIAPIPQGTEVLVSYEYLLKGGEPAGLTAETVLRRVADNFNQIQDMQAEIETTSTITVDGETKEEPSRRNKYTFLSPDKHRIETYTNSGEKVGVNIIKGNELYLVNALGKYQKIDLLKISGISIASFNQMDFMGKLDEFITAHDVVLEEKAEIKNNVSVVSAVPKEPTPIYNKIELYIDRGKGVIEKSVLYRDGEKKQEVEFNDYRWKNPAWIASMVVLKPVSEKGEYITVVNFKDVKVNQGVPESEFDPETVSQGF